MLVGQLKKLILPWLLIGSILLIVGGLQFSSLIDQYETYRTFEDEGQRITAEVDSYGDTSLRYHFTIDGRQHNANSYDVSSEVTAQAARTGTVDLLYIPDDFRPNFVIAVMNTPPGLLQIGQMVLFVVGGLLFASIGAKQWFDMRRLQDGFLVEALVTHVTYFQQAGHKSGVIQYAFESPTSGKSLTGEARIGGIGQPPERGNSIAVLYHSDNLYQAL